MHILHTQPKADGFFMPAEFAPHDGCIMIWPERSDSWRNGAYAARCIRGSYHAGQQSAI